MFWSRKYLWLFRWQKKLAVFSCLDLWEGPPASIYDGHLFFYCIFGLNVKALVSHSYSSLNESITCFTEDKGIFLCTIDFGPIRWAMHINMTGWSSLWVGVSNVPSTQKRGAPLILWRDLADFIK